MFKRNLTAYMVIVGLVIGSCPCFAIDKDKREAIVAAVEKLGDYQKYTYILLDSSEFPDISKEKVGSGPWVVKFEPNSEPLLGVEFGQVFEFQNSPVKTVLRYGCFADENVAKEALSVLVMDSAEPHQSEPWPDFHLASKPHSIYYSINSSSSAWIAFRYGTTCVLVNSLRGSLREQRQNAIFFADAIVNHLRELQGEAVIPLGDSVVAETNAPTPAQKESSNLSEETPPEPVPEPEVPAPSPKSAKHTPRVAPWLVLLCIGGLAVLGWCAVRKKREASKE